MTSSDKATLITGAGGYLGARLARRLLDLADRPVVAWLHAENENELAAKARALRAFLGANGSAAKICGGDLRWDRPFAGVDPGEIGRIVHAAAVTRFNVERPVAERVNVDGATKLYQFASRCPALDRLALLSSVYACGLATGTVAEAPVSEPPVFANHYEWSKWESERRLVRDHDALPWSILRVATVVAENTRGDVIQYNAFHNTLKLLFYGLVSLIPGDRKTPLYFVTADFTVNAVIAALNAEPAGRVYHVCHTRDESLSLGELVDIAYERFGTDRDFAERRLLKPLFCDAATFELLVDGVDAFGGDVVRQGLGSIVPFAAQLFSEKTFENQHLREVHRRYQAPEAGRLVRNACDYLTRTRWGARLEQAA